MRTNRGVMVRSLFLAGLTTALGGTAFSTFPVEVSTAELLAAEAQSAAPQTRANASTISPLHRRMIAGITARARAGQPLPAVCFAPGTDEETVIGVSDALGLAEPTRAQLGNRWTRTATDGNGLTQGQPCTITYSFVPDGTFVPDPFGGGDEGPSNLQAYLNGIYGNPTAWKAVFAAVFARWSELSGITYVYEPADDGSELAEGSGALGVRGDVRIAGIFIDGNSGVLAYNYFPNDGDMVLDTGDGFYTNTDNASLRLRNVVAHEHGHGIALHHVCPINGTKLMEPFVSTGYDGPRHDDVRGAQRLYGDPYEPDNSAATATHIGTLSAVTPLIVGDPPPPALANTATLSIDADGEQDYFRFTTQTPINLSVTVTPLGLNYDDSPQSCSGQGNCCSGDFTNSLLIADLNVAVIDRNGTTVLATAQSAPAGSVETVSNLALVVPGDYYVRVFEAGAPSEAQLYRLNLSATSGVSCFDGVQNQGETRIDCGGPCPACACTTNAACSDGLFCSGAEVCDAYGDCQPGTPACANQSCRESDDACIAFGNGDYNSDGDVDLGDFGGLQDCFGAEAFGACVRVNLAGSAKVDAADSAAFLARLNGP